MTNWNEKVAIVTGGASGIGAATAREFAARGSRAIIFDINAQGAERVVNEIRASGGQAESYLVDVADAAACQRVVTGLAEKHGRLDYLVNNAVSFITAGLDVTTEQWERSLGVNVRGYANMVQAAHAPMRDSGGGAIVNIASISAHIAQPNRWTYNATKGAIVTMTKCQALDLAPDHIRVNTVSPGWIWTPEVAKAASGDREKWEPVWGRFAMLRRLGEPEEVAKAIVFLCSDDASFITATELFVDGGYNGLGSEGLGDQSTFAGSE
jgi:NAD(P)-dependent dehydrogenase (short-subunit alcohol dehydrogenase family)